MNKLLYFILSFNICLGYHSSAQIINDSTFAFTAYWAKGDIFYFNVNYSEEYSAKDGQIKKVSYDYSVMLEVTDSLNDAYILDWTYYDFKNIKSDREIDNVFIELLNNKVIRYKVDEFGGFIEFVNWEKYRDMTLNSLEKLTSYIALSDSVKNKVKNIIYTTVSTKDKFENFFSQEINLLHYLCGVELPINKTETYVKDYINPFFNGYFSGEQSIGVIELDKEKLTSKVDINAGLSKEYAKLLIYGYMMEFKDSLNITEEITLDKIPDYSISEIYRYKLNIDYGQVMYLYYENSVLTDKKHNKKVYVFKLQD